MLCMYRPWINVYGRPLEKFSNHPENYTNISKAKMRKCVPKNKGTMRMTSDDPLNLLFDTRVICTSSSTSISFATPPSNSITKGKSMHFANLLSFNKPIIGNLVAQDDFINLMLIGSDEPYLVDMCKEFDALTFIFQPFFQTIFYKL